MYFGSIMYMNGKLNNLFKSLKHALSFSHGCSSVSGDAVEDGASYPGFVTSGRVTLVL